jgi:hypothetical protein
MHHRQRWRPPLPKSIIRIPVSAPLSTDVMPHLSCPRSATVPAIRPARRPETTARLRPRSGGRNALSTSAGCADVSACRPPLAKTNARVVTWVQRSFGSTTWSSTEMMRGSVAIAGPSDVSSVTGITTEIIGTESTRLGRCRQRGNRDDHRGAVSRERPRALGCHRRAGRNVEGQLPTAPCRHRRASRRIGSKGADIFRISVVIRRSVGSSQALPAESLCPRTALAPNVIRVGALR